jgi:hypothetical protein
MATYLISVHTLLRRLHAEQAVDEEHYCHSNARFDDVELDVQKTSQLNMIERKEIDMRATSCPATTLATRRPQPVEP